MINEIDLKDFKDIDCTQARESLEQVYVHGEGFTRHAEYLADFIKQIEVIQRKYNKPVAALLRKD